MNVREALRVKRTLLLERAERERGDLSRAWAQVQRPLAVADRSVSFVRTLRRMPVLGAAVGAGMAALAFVRPGSLVDWVPGGHAIWQLLLGLLSKPARRAN